MLPVEVTWLHNLVNYVSTCPWLWWLGMSETPASLRRRATDGSIFAKLVPVLLVPLLTAVATAYITLRTLEYKVDMIVQEVRSNRAEQRGQVEHLQNQLWEHIRQHNNTGLHN